MIICQLRKTIKLLTFSLVIAVIPSCGTGQKPHYENSDLTTPVNPLTLADDLGVKISSYPKATILGLLPSSYRWMQAVSLTEGLTTAQPQIKAAPIIAVLDSGVDYLHPALADRIYKIPDGMDADCPGDTKGCNTSKYNLADEQLGNGEVFPLGTTGGNQPCAGNIDDPMAELECAHGTHVSGVISGFDSNTQVYGVCPICRILIIKVVGDQGSITDIAIIGALQYIAKLKSQGVPIRIVNGSFGKFLGSKQIATAIESSPPLRDDLLIVAAAGNENTQIRSYPAALKNVVAVANVNSSNLAKDAKSNFGSWVDIAAPVGNCVGEWDLSTGFGVISSTPGNDSRCSNGTSIAAPIVAGVAGMILATNPQISIKELRSRLLETADAKALYDANPQYLAQVNNQTIPLLGSGVVNLKNALQNLKTGIPTSKQQKSLSPGCGTVKSRTTTVQGRFSLFLLLFLPFFLVSPWRRLRNIHRPAELVLVAIFFSTLALWAQNLPAQSEPSHSDVDTPSDFLWFLDTSYSRTVQATAMPSAADDSTATGLSGENLASFLAAARGTFYRRGPLTLDGQISFRYDQFLIKDLWTHYQPAAFDYEKFPLGLQYSRRIYYLGCDPQLALMDKLVLALPMSYQLTRWGSDLFRSTDSVNYRATTLDTRIKVEPTLHFTSNERYDLFAYTAFDGSNDKVVDDASYQTYARGRLAITLPTTSYGLGSNILSTDHRSEQSIKVIHYNFVLNQSENNFIRDGIWGSSYYRLWQNFYAGANIGFMRDSYQNSLISFDNCSSVAGGSSANATISLCKRTDYQKSAALQLAMHLSGAYFTTFSYSYHERENKALPVFAMKEQKILLSILYTPTTPTLSLYKTRSDRLFEDELTRIDTMLNF